MTRHIVGFVAKSRDEAFLISYLLPESFVFASARILLLVDSPFFKPGVYRPVHLVSYNHFCSRMYASVYMCMPLRPLITSGMI